MGLGKTIADCSPCCCTRRRRQRRPARSCSSARPRSSATGSRRRRASRPTCACCPSRRGRVGRATPRASPARSAARPGHHHLQPAAARRGDAGRTCDWGGVVLDEAQNIKNAETQAEPRGAQADGADPRRPDRHAGREPPRRALVDHGLPQSRLPRHAQALPRSASPCRSSGSATPRPPSACSALTRPFILRRLKTDPTIISDLPEKIEMKVYCTLTREQATLYEAVVRDGLRQRRGGRRRCSGAAWCWRMLTQLKQVCNHPAHLLGDGSAAARAAPASWRGSRRCSTRCSPRATAR